MLSRKTKHARMRLLLLGLCLTLAGQAHAGPSADAWSRTRLRLQAGMGAGWPRDEPMTALGLYAHYDRHVLGARVGGLGWLVFDELVWDLALLYGLAHVNRDSGFYAALGPSLVRSVDHGLFQDEPVPFADTGGLAFALGGYIAPRLGPFSALGLGGEVFGNLNGGRSFVGVMVTLQIGKLHERVFPPPDWADLSDPD